MQNFRQSVARGATLLLLAVPLAVACRGPGHGMANMTEGEIADRMTHMVEWGLDPVDADDAQIERVGQIVSGVAPDVVRFREEHRSLMAELRAELAKNPIDHARVEAIRKQTVLLFDRASEKGSATLLAAAEVLTPEQRAELTYRWEKHRP